MTARLSCLVYGLGVHLNLPLAGLAGLLPTPHRDVTLTLGSMPPQFDVLPSEAWQPYFVSDDLDENGVPDVKVWRLSGGDYFRIVYPDGTVVVLDARGSQVWATWVEPWGVEDTAAYLLGPTLGFVLRLRGLTCLHASAVVVDGRAVALVGPSGAGKSTTAAAFAGMGYPVLTDDVLALGEASSGFMVQPAYPRVRLWPESVASMFGSAEALPRISPGWDKRFLDLNGPGYRFQYEALPLAAIYFLGEHSTDASAPRIQAVGAREGLMSLVANTYANYLLDKAMRADEFSNLSQLVDRVPLRRVIPNGDFAKLPALCRLVADDCRQLFAGAGVDV